LKGTSIHKVQPRFAIFGGLGAASSGAASATPASAGQRKLQHIDPGLLSVAADGSHFAITLARALVLDDNYRVIGRVGKGSELLAKFDEVQTDIEDVPEQPMTIDQCGTTDHRGLNETLSQAAAGGSSASDAAAVTRGHLADASASVMDALAQGLKRKPAAAAAAPAGKGPASAKAASKKRTGMMGALPDEEDDDSDVDSAGDAA
jgi:cyclophilin family peptidyl-prolyl cis-trans isomerase